MEKKRFKLQLSASFYEYYFDTREGALKGIKELTPIVQTYPQPLFCRFLLTDTQTGKEEIIEV